MTSRALEVGMTDGWGIKVGGKGMGEWVERQDLPQ